MAPNLKEYDAACADYFRRWATFNDVLYAMCRKYPDHIEPGHINAKFGIIGRSFATGLERKMKSRGGQGSTLAVVGEYVFKHRRDVQEVFEGLAGIKEPLTEERLATIIAAHGCLNRLLRGMTRGRQSLRSFVAKYMHFHCPAVPIYDTFAEKALRREVRWHDDLMVFGSIPRADPQYHWFCARFWHLYQELRRRRKKATVRLADVYLLWMGDM